MNANQNIEYHEFIQRENHFIRAPYNPELEFYSAVKSGNTAKVAKLCEEPLIEKKGLGVLSDNFLRHMQYHFTITAALLARYCIEGGMELSASYSLSDYYIQKADCYRTPEEVSKLHRIMCLDYTKRMKALRIKPICSKPIVQCIDYIYENLHTRIKVQTLSDLTGLTPSYLSKLFKKETGYSISGYIQNKKIATAQNILIYSDYSISEIASTLAFPSQSYFTEVFHKYSGMTPLAYRTKYFRNTQMKPFPFQPPLTIVCTHVILLLHA